MNSFYSCIQALLGASSGFCCNVYFLRILRSSPTFLHCIPFKLTSLTRFCFFFFLLLFRKKFLCFIFFFRFFATFLLFAHTLHSCLAAFSHTRTKCVLSVLVAQWFVVAGSCTTKFPLSLCTSHCQVEFFTPTGISVNPATKCRLQFHAFVYFCTSF